MSTVMEQIVLLNTIIVARGTVVSQISNPNPRPSVKSKRNTTCWASHWPKYESKYIILITCRQAELHVWLGPYEEWGTSQQGPRMPLTCNSEDGPLSERHREGHAGTGSRTSHDYLREVLFKRYKWVNLAICNHISISKKPLTVMPVYAFTACLFISHCWFLRNEEAPR